MSLITSGASSTSVVDDSVILQPPNVFREERKQATVCTQFGNKVIEYHPRYTEQQLSCRAKEAVDPSESTNAMDLDDSPPDHTTRLHESLRVDTSPCTYRVRYKCHPSLTKVIPDVMNVIVSSVKHHPDVWFHHDTFAAAFDSVSSTLTVSFPAQYIDEAELWKAATLLSMITAEGMSQLQTHECLWTLDTTLRCLNCNQWIWGCIGLCPVEYDVVKDTFKCLPQAHCSKECMKTTLMEQEWSMEPFYLMYGDLTQSAPPRTLMDLHLPGGVNVVNSHLNSVCLLHERKAHVTTVAGEVVVSMCLRETIDNMLTRRQQDTTVASTPSTTRTLPKTLNTQKKGSAAHFGSFENLYQNQQSSNGKDTLKQ